MSVYPKRRGVKKLAEGGVADPFLGVGIQYQERQADIPNVDAARAYAEAEQRRQQYLEEERLKRKPSRSAVLEMLSKMEGTEGQKKAFQDTVLGQLDEYDAKSRKDPNWVFSDEGVNAYASLIDTSMDPGRAEQLRNNYSLIQSGYDQISKNNTRDAYQISAGQILARDKDGNVSRVPLSSLSQGYTPLTADEQYSSIVAAPTYTHEKDALIPMLNKDDATKTLLDAFSTASGQIQSAQGIMDVTSNAQALRAAKQQAKDAMSESVRSSLQSDYIKNIGQGQYSQEGFDQYVDQLLNSEIAKRKRYSSQISSDAIRLSQAMDKGQEVVDPADQPWYHVTNTTKTVRNSAGIDSNIDISIYGESNVPAGNEVIPSLKIDGLAYSFGGGSWGSGFLGLGKDGANFSAEQNKDGYVGGPKKINKTYENAQIVGRSIVPLTTGQVFNNDFTRSAEVIDNGLMVIKSDDDSYRYGGGAIMKGTQVQEIEVSEVASDGKTYRRTVQVMPRSDGKFVEVKMAGMNMYSVDAGGVDATIAVPMTRPESLRSFGVNLSVEQTNTDYFVSGNRFPSDPNSSGQTILRKVAALNPVLHKELIDRLSQIAAKPITLREKEEINALLNHVRSKIEDKSITNTFSFPKESYTKKDATDFIR